MEIARAAASHPRVIVLDEPFSGLNPAESKRLSHALAHINKTQGIAMVLVEHDVEIVFGLSERVFVLDFGVLIALYTVVAQPGAIGRLLLESPSLWASGRQLLAESRSVRIWPERTFLAVGSNEAGNAERSRSVVDDVRELAAIIRRAVLSESRLQLVIKDGAGHNEAAWAERFREALQFLFGR